MPAVEGGREGHVLGADLADLADRAVGDDAVRAVVRRAIQGTSKPGTCV